MQPILIDNPNEPDTAASMTYLPDVAPTASDDIPSAPYVSPASDAPGDPLPPAVHPVATSRPWWRPAVILAVLLVLLATGIGIGFAAANRTTAKVTTASQSIVTTSSSSVTLPATVADLQGTIITVTKATQASVVEVTSMNSAGTALGSGEFLTKDGYIVTNDHVVAGYTSYAVTLANGANYPATLVGADAQDDLAVLKISIQNATPITFADSSQTAIGEFVVAVGNPLGLQESASFGIVSATNRTEAEQSTSSNGATTTGAVLTGLIQTTAALNPGNSGGALVNLQGQLIGIPTLGAATTASGETVSGVGFAISSNRVLYVVNQLMQSGHLTSTNQGFLGVEGQDVTANSGLSVAQGVQVQGFSNDAVGASPAQAAGVQIGDIITAINGQAITDTADLAGAVLTATPGAKITLTIERGTTQKTLSVTLGERPVQ